MEYIISNPGYYGVQVQGLHLPNPGYTRGPYETDPFLYSRQLGNKRWSAVAASLPSRTGKQCRARWNNHVRPDIKRGTWSSEEELLLVKEHGRLGNRWADIAELIPGRCGAFPLNTFRLCDCPTRD